MVYEIVKFEVLKKGGGYKTFHTFRERPDLTKKAGDKFSGKSDYYVDQEGFEVKSYGHFELSEVKPAGAISAEERFLPYFADVTEDLPGWATWEPEKYKNCQLLAQKHNNYLEFYDHATGETHRIAMNSNTYEPA